MEYYEIRHQVLTAIQEAVSQGLIHGTSGNLAVRDPASGMIAITPSGIAYATMRRLQLSTATGSGWKASTSPPQKPPCIPPFFAHARMSTPPYIPMECSVH